MGWSCEGKGKPLKRERVPLLMMQELELRKSGDFEM